MNKDNQAIFEAYNDNQRVIVTHDNYGNAYHYLNGLLHRDGGPAIEGIGETGIKKWYKDGNKHREDGPAVIRPHGDSEYHLDGVEYQTMKDWAAAVLQSRNMPHEAADVQEFIRNMLAKQTKDLI